MPLAAADRSKLAAVLALLGSPHAGERDAAALAADRLVRGRGLVWQDVLGGGHAPSPAAGPDSWATTDWQADLSLCLTNIRSLSAWEENFVLSMSSRRGGMSSAQRAKLAQIAAELRTKGPCPG